MSNSEDFRIPKTLDDPALILFFEADSTVLFVSVMAIFGLISFFGGFILAFFLTKTYNKLKANGSKGMILQMAYWYLPSSWLSQRYPSNIREFVGR